MWQKLFMIMPRETTTKTISFIIVNYQSSDKLSACIESISRHMPSDWSYEVILVNNDVQKITQRIYTSVDHVIELGKNYGYGYANNRGVDVAVGDILCFFNPDARFVSSIDAILASFKERNIGIMAPRLITQADTTQEWSVGSEMTLQELVRSHIGYARSKKLWQSQKKTDVAWVSGAAMFIRREIFVKIEGFDEEFFLYYEDIDLCRRALRIDSVRIMYDPSVKVRHISGASSDDQKRQKSHYYKSQDRYFQKHFHPIIASIVYILRAPYRFIK